MTQNLLLDTPIGMTPQLWIGFGFLAFLVMFMVAAFFVKPDLTRSQHGQMRFFSALCASLAAGFITGGALFEYAKTFPDGGKIAFTGVAGFALFGLIWMTYPPHQPKTPEGSMTMSLDAGELFRVAALAAAQREHCVVELNGFQEAERDAKLLKGSLRGKTSGDLLRQLRGLTNGAVREYRVEQDTGIYRLTIS